MSEYKQTEPTPKADDLAALNDVLPRFKQQPVSEQQGDAGRVEELSRELHAIYQAEARRQAGVGDDEVRHPDDYGSLAEHTKEYDRVLARFILARERALEQSLAQAEADAQTSKVNADLMRPVVDRALREDVFYRLEQAESALAQEQERSRRLESTIAQFRNQIAVKVVIDSKPRIVWAGDFDSIDSLHLHQLVANFVTAYDALEASEPEVGS